MGCETPRRYCVPVWTAKKALLRMRCNLQHAYRSSAFIRLRAEIERQEVTMAKPGSDSFHEPQVYGRCASGQQRHRCFEVRQGGRQRLPAVSMADASLRDRSGCILGHQEDVVGMGSCRHQKLDGQGQAFNRPLRRTQMLARTLSVKSEERIIWKDRQQANRELPCRGRYTRKEISAEGTGLDLR
jgi:hypothetical protein